MEVVSRPLMQIFDPFTLTFYRFVVGFIFLFLMLLIRGEKKDLFSLTLKTILVLALLGFLNTFFSMSMLQLAVKHANAATAAVIFCSNPLFVFLFSVLSRQESFHQVKAAGLAAGIGGIAFVSGGGGMVLGGGVLYALSASISFALYTVLNKRVLKGVKPLTVNVVSFFFGLIFTAIYMSFAGIGAALPQSLFSDVSALFSFIYLGVVISGIGYITFINTIKDLGPVAASIIFLLKPVIATFLAVIFLGEQLHGLFFPGIVLIAAGSGLIVVIRRREAKGQVNIA